MKILTIIGARPQFIKAAAVSRVIAEQNTIQEVILHTGQHFDENMSHIFFDQLQIPKPLYNLEINSLNHGAMTGRMMEAIEQILLQEKSDLVMVYGDTNSTLAGALAASKLHIPVAHVEAGLRSYNMQMPEEINRILTDRISKYLFCPTDTAMNNLKKEGFDYIDCQVVNTGDVMYDAAMYYSSRAIKPKIDIPNKFVLVTLHRAENTDNLIQLTHILDALHTIAAEVPVVLPLHPRTRKIIEQNNLIPASSNLIISEPVGYLNMIYLLEHCQMVMTDSGGLQKEAYFFEKPCITLRAETEWIELVESGVNKLAGFETQRILAEYNSLVNNPVVFPENLYGDGKAAEKIVNYLK